MRPSKNLILFPLLFVLTTCLRYVTHADKKEMLSTTLREQSLYYMTIQRRIKKNPKYDNLFNELNAWI